MIMIPSFLAVASSHRLTTEAQGPQGFDDHVEENHYYDDDMKFIVVSAQNCDDDNCCSSN